MSKIEVNQISSQCGSTLTIGQSGDTVTLACGATQSGFGRTGTVDWNTTAITADPANAVSGTGYFANTTSAAFTITLPTSPSAGDIVAVRDYAQTFATNNLTIGRNGQPIDGISSDLVLSTNGQAITLVYVDGTQGWKSVNSNETINEIKYVAATGGTVTCCGDYKIHTFTGPGTFTVTCAGNAAGSNSVDYLVVAGGGGGGSSNPGSGNSKGGGGAGGLRFSADTYCAPAPSSPLAASALPVTAQGYPITVGSGGSTGGPNQPGTPGNNSVFSTITSAGGGQGGGGGSACSGTSGGSGGSNSSGPTSSVINAGNTPPVSPPQGNPSGIPGGCGQNAAGGGGASVAGTNGDYTPSSGDSSGGAGLDINITGSPVTRAGGGGGGGGVSGSGWVGTGGAGGGGNGAPFGSGSGGNGTTNTGGGGGGAGNQSCGTGGTGGSGIVIIRYKYQ